MRKIIGILINLFLGFMTCPCLRIFISNIQGTSKGAAYISTVSRQPVALRSSASDNFSSKQLKNPETMRFSGFFLFRLFALFWHSLTRFEPFFMG